MGSNAIQTMSIGFALASFVIFYFAPNVFDSVIMVFPAIGISERTVKHFLSQYHPNYEYSQMKNDVSSGENKVDAIDRLFTKEELSKYHGGPDSEGLYLAILGDVFDVAKGAQHYKPGSAYAFFAGRDASRAYLTGDFSDEKNVDDVSDLDDAAIISLGDWLSFYREEYLLKGRLIGHYYDKEGNPTAVLQKIQEKIESGQTNKWVDDNEKNIFPPCNSEWSKEIGSRVWCTNKSGGVDRDWVGVPRQFFKKGKDPRCVCVRDAGPPSNHQDSEKHSDLGDLEHPNLHEYPDCPKRASSCQVAHP